MATSLPGFSRGTARLAVALLLAAVLGGAVALLVAARWATPRDDSPEAGFARDMATHHAQAVEMSFVIRDKSEDEEIRTLAYDIAVTQSTQRGVLMGWLQEWGLAQASARPRMAWAPEHAHMEHGTGGLPSMHGMASDDELRRLRAARGEEAEILFLQLMIRHHEGGVIMARALGRLSHRKDIVRMAQSMDSGQRAEIAEMTALLAKRAARPLASLLERGSG
jgi:uncharacterized protein (DUF305 family)